MPAKTKGLLARRCISGPGARQLIVNGQPLKAPRLYQHPAHAHPVTNVGRSPGWSCALCRFAQTEGGEQRQRYHCEQGCQFDVCADCMGAEYSPWLIHRDAFFRGDAIVFPGLKYLGHLSMRQHWPDAANHEKYMEMFDVARRAGDMFWRGKEPRSLHLSSTQISITSDPSSMMEWERGAELKVHARLPATELASVTCLDDSPCFIVALVGPQLGCHVLECPSLEVAEGICDTVQRAYDHIFQETVLDTIDDSIQAGLEGRPAKYAPPEVRFVDTLREAQRRSLMEESSEDENESIARPPAPREEQEREQEEEKAAEAPVVLSGEQQAALIAEYMGLLKRTLGQAEVMKFAELLRDYRLYRQFSSFVKGLQQLFGEHSEMLLPGIQPFLPLEDRPAFEKLLASH